MSNKKFPMSGNHMRNCRKVETRRQRKRNNKLSDKDKELVKIEET